VECGGGDAEDADEERKIGVADVEGTFYITMMTIAVALFIHYAYECRKIRRSAKLERLRQKALADPQNEEATEQFLKQRHKQDQKSIKGMTHADRLQAIEDFKERDRQEKITGEEGPTLSSRWIDEDAIDPGSVFTGISGEFDVSR
jgi:hypothetical protein